MTLLFKWDNRKEISNPYGIMAYMEHIISLICPEDQPNMLQESLLTIAIS